MAQPVELEEKDPVVIGTLTCEENETLDMLLDQSHSQPQAEMGKTTLTLTKTQPHYGEMSEVMDEKSTCTNVQAPILDDTTQMDLNCDDYSDSTIILDYQSESYMDTLNIGNSNNIPTKISEEKNNTQIKSVFSEENTITRLEQQETTSCTFPMDKTAMEIDSKTSNKTG